MNRSKIKIRNLDFFYKNHQILSQVNQTIPENAITAIVGPSGIGKSTFLSLFNRLWENIPGAKIKGSVLVRFSGNKKKGFCDINAPNFSALELRRAVGMVFQTPNPLPMSIFKNVSFPLKLAGINKKNEVNELVTGAIKACGLWPEVKERLDKKASVLSGGQQQRLCMARALVMNPEILLLDEPTSSLDPASGEKIEQLMVDLKKRCTLVMVSHNHDQVKNICDHVFELVI
ncbi:MAG: ATP-binding cassette domain-containing protein [Desulfobacterium sp.]|nr:ATP-binding cassette domain-containing protein [Desulfobacterium sp.]